MADSSFFIPIVGFCAILSLALSYRQSVMQRGIDKSMILSLPKFLCSSPHPFYPDFCNSGEKHRLIFARQAYFY